MDNKKLMRIYAPKTVFYLVVILCLCVIIGILYIDAAIPLAVLFSGILFQFFWQYFRKQKEIIRHIENLTLNIDSASKDTLLNFPMPLVVLETDGTISWYNRLFRAFTKDREILDKKIGELIAGIDIDELVRNQGTLTTRTELSGRHYQVLGSFVRTEDKPGREKYLILL
jgi:c-di-AMP phosphodiesterase-like protein